MDDERNSGPAQPNGEPLYGQPEYGQPPYGQPQYGAQPYGAPPYGTAQYGAPQYGSPQYGAPQYGAQPYGAPGYGTDQYGNPYAAQQYGYPAGYAGSSQPPGTGMGIAGFVTGLVGVLLCWIPGLGVICSLLGVIFGAIGLNQLKRVGGNPGLAIAGLVLGVLGVVLFVVFLIAWSNDPYPY
jgi:hypothetical protein